VDRDFRGRQAYVHDTSSYGVTVHNYMDDETRATMKVRKQKQ
jgi:hypothetical protein